MRVKRVDLDIQDITEPKESKEPKERKDRKEMMKIALVEILQDSHEKHEHQIQKILREHEKSLASVVDGAVRKAIARLALTETEPQAVVIPIATEEPCKMQQGPCSKSASLKSSPTSKNVEQTSPNSHLLSPKSVTRKAHGQSSSFDSMRAVVDHRSGRSTPVAPRVESSVNLVGQNIHSVSSWARKHSSKSKMTIGQSSWESRLMVIARHPMFDAIVAKIILANAVMIAIQTEMMARDPHGQAPSFFRAIDLFFTGFFVVELLMRLLIEKQQFLTGRNKGWNVFDAFVVVSAITEEFLKASTNMTAIRILRIMRLVRAIRVLRTLRMFSDLRAMVKGIVTSILSLVWALVLLFMILFVIGIFITQVVTGFRAENSLHDGNHGDPKLDDVLESNFGSLFTTIYSLYKAITGGDDWSGLADPLFQISSVLGIFFCMYIAFALFAVLNVITGVFVDNAIKANHSDADVIIMEQTAARKKHIEEVKSVFRKADTDGSGKLTLPEFVQHVENPYVQAYFRHLGLDIHMDTARSLFDLLDFDDSGFIDIEEFIFGCDHLKGHARSLDLARMWHDQSRQGNIMAALASKQNNRLDAVFRTAQKLAPVTDGDQAVLTGHQDVTVTVPPVAQRPTSPVTVTPPPNAASVTPTQQMCPPGCSNT